MRYFPVADRDELGEMLAEAEAWLDVIMDALAVSPEAEQRRQASRARCQRWIGMVRNDLDELERTVEA